MSKIRFTNIFRSVTLDLSDEAVALIRQGRHPNTVLSNEDARTVTDSLSRRPEDWSMIFAYENDGTILWVQPAPRARYMNRRTAPSPVNE